MLTAQLAELRRAYQAADGRASMAEEEAQRLARMLSRREEEAELWQYRALAAQQERGDHGGDWRTREKRLEQQLQERTTRVECLESELLECRRRLAAIPTREEEAVGRVWGTDISHEKPPKVLGARSSPLHP